MTRDILSQAYGAMRHDLRKTLLTMLGMAWGIATVVLLLAYGEGGFKMHPGIVQQTEIAFGPGHLAQECRILRKTIRAAAEHAFQIFLKNLERLFRDAALPILHTKHRQELRARWVLVFGPKPHGFID